MSRGSFLQQVAAQKRRLGVGLGILAAAIALYGLLGYFWLPGYAKTKLESELSKVLQRPVTVQSIEIQPYTLELTVRGFRVGEKPSGAEPAETLLSFDELYSNLSIATVTRLAPVIRSVILRGPALRLVREGESRFNITDLVEYFMKRPAGGKTMFSVSNILIEEGRFVFVDKVKKSRQEISDIRAGVPFIANFERNEQSWVEPHFSAKVNGAPLTLEARLRPFTETREATLELKSNDIDLTRIDEYSPVPVGISLHSGYLDTNLMLTFVEVDGEAPKIVLTGQAALRKLRIENRSTEIPYTAEIAQLDIRPVEFNLNGSKPSQAALKLTDAVIVREGDSKPVLSLPLLTMSQSSIDIPRKSIALGGITVDRLNASLRRESDGRLEVAKLFSRAPGFVADLSSQAPGTEAVQETTPAKPGAGKPWEVRLASFELTGAALRFEDVSLTNIAPMVIQPLDLTVNNIDLTGAAPLNLTLKAIVNQHGSLETNGTLAWAPLAAEFSVEAKDIDLVALQGWAGNWMNALITSGATSFRGKVKADGSPVKVGLSGDSQFTNFSVLDKSTTIMRWRTLDISGIEFVNDPLRVNVNSIALADFFAHVILTPQGELNLKHIVRQEGDQAPPVIQAPAGSETVGQITATSGNTTSRSTTSPPDRKPIPVRIGSILLRGGNVNFNDQFIKPNYRANLTGLIGRVGPLDPGKPGEIDIHGAIDRIAPLKISGEVNTFGKELYLDITAAAKGIEMPTFSPYSGKYIGYTIEKGKLSVDVRYHVEKGELTAENNVFLDQLTFGEKVESPDALSIPVTLAVALLQNRRGEIDIHMPISGSINDPQFSVGALLVEVFVNLLTKAVTAPFSLLESAFGSGEQLSEISFSPGRAELDAEAEKRLQTLSKALIDRPTLKLEITGQVDPVDDPEAWKRAVLERNVKAKKLVEAVKKGETGVSLDNIELKPEEYPKYLALAYKEEKFEKPKNVVGLTKSLPVPEMEQLMLANIDAGESAMRELAQVRGEAARDWLIEKGGVPGDRIFLLEPKVEAKAGSKKSASRVQFSLR